MLKLGFKSRPRDMELLLLLLVVIARNIVVLQNFSLT